MSRDRWESLGFGLKPAPPLLPAGVQNVPLLFQDEAACAAMRTVELDNMVLGGSAVQHREVSIEM